MVGKRLIVAASMIQGAFFFFEIAMTVRSCRRDSICSPWGRERRVTRPVQGCEIVDRSPEADEDIGRNSRFVSKWSKRLFAWTRNCCIEASLDPASRARLGIRGRVSIIGLGVRTRNKHIPYITRLPSHLHMGVVHMAPSMPGNSPPYQR